MKVQPTNTVPEKPQVSLPSSSKQNWIMLGVAASIIALISSAGTYLLLQSQSKNSPQAQTTQPTGYLSPTQTKSDETANWKTYTNTAYRYSISFPSNLKTLLMAAHSGGIEAIPDARGFDIYDPNIPADNDYSSTYLVVNVFGLVGPSFDKLTKSDIKIGDVKAVKYSDPKDAHFDIIVIPIPSTSEILQIGISKDPKKAVLANQILSTFQFISE